MKTFLAKITPYLLLLATISFAAGITCSRYFPVDSPANIYLSFFCCLVSFIFWFVHLNRAAVAMLCVSFFMAGCLMPDHRQQPMGDIFHIRDAITDSEETVLIGILSKMVEGGGQSQKVTIETAFYRTQDMPFFQRVSGSVLLSLNGEWPRTLLPGSTVAIRAVLKKPSHVNTPGTFNYPDFLARKGISLVGTISSPLLIRGVAHQVNTGSKYSYLVERIRTSIANGINDTLSPEPASLYRAVLLGDRSTIDPVILESFKGAGVMHILAISGIHMALLGIFLFASIFWLMKRVEGLILSTNVRKLSMLLSIPFLLLYMLLAGAQAPVMRSFFMSVLVVAALCSDRMKSPVTLLAGAGLIMLMIDPLSLEGASFQLSFSAVAAIIIITPRILKLLPIKHLENSPRTANQKAIQWILTAISVTISATIGTAPLLIYHFNRLSTVTIPANLIIEPLICLWSLPCGFLSIPFMFIYPPLAQMILQVGAQGLILSVEIVSFLAQIPFSTVWFPTPPPAAIILYYVSLVVLTSFSLSSRYFRAAGLVFISSLIILTTPLSRTISSFYKNEDTVSFIDVGQGSSSLVTLSSGRTILIDGGALSAPGYDCGERVIAPFLWHQGIGRLDDIVLTHADADHYNGLSSVIERFRPKRIWLPHLKDSKPGYASLCRLARKKYVDLKIPSTNLSFSDGNSNLEIITLREDSPKDTYTENDSGLIVTLQTPGFSTMFPGDISAEKELELVDSKKNLRADILLSPHHGSSSSNSHIFLNAVDPDYLIVSAGQRKNDLFPSVQTQTTAERLGIRLLTTADNGTISVHGKDSSFTVRTYRIPEAQKRQQSRNSHSGFRSATPR